MTFLARARSFFKTLVHRGRLERDMAEEWQFHIDARVDALLATGLARHDAVRQARKEFGDTLRWREQSREAVGLRWLRDLTWDVRHALRQLRRSPGFTAVAVLTLALGIGANTAIFSIVNAVFLRPLPYPMANQLFRVQRINNRVGGNSISPAIYTQWQARTDVFEAIGVLASTRPATLQTGGEPVSVQATMLSPGVLIALGVQPHFGRLFETDDEHSGSPDVAVISDALWRTQFGSDPHVLGKVVVINARAVALVGVMPADFELPWPFTKGTQLWLPYRLPPGSDANASNGMVCLGRLRDGVSIGQAAAALTPPLVTLSHQFPDLIRPNEQATLVPVGDALRAGAGTAPLLLLGAVAFVLLIACVNIANLLLARATARQQEMTVRASLGASRGRILRQVLTESVLLGALGAVAGLAVCTSTFDAILRLVPAELPYLGAIRIDRAVLAFAASLGVLTGILFGLAPALTMSMSDHSIVMKDGTSRAGLSRRRRQVASALTVGEIALGLVLLVGAALLLESFSRLTRVDVGFDPNHVTTFTVSLPRTFDTPAKRIVAYDQIRAQLEVRPAFQHVAYINGLPLSQGDVLFRVEGRSSAQDAKGDARVRFTSPDYFSAMRIPLVRGRALTAQDSESSEPVIVVNRSLAEHFWPNGDALGAFVWIGQPMGPAQAERAPRRIVGIVGDIRGYSVAGGLSDDMYEPAAQSLGGGAVSFAIRSNEDLGTLTPHVSEILRAMLPDQPVPTIRTMDDVIATSASVKDERFHAVLLGLFGTLGLLIVLVGVYGVASYAVAQRTHEFGVRLALGASPRRIRAMVLQHGLAMAVTGTTVGLTVSFALTRLLGGLLFDVAPNDPLTLAAASATMVVVALGACWIPARRATKVDPLVALRCE